MDKRYKPLPPEEQLKRRIALLEEFSKNPGMPLGPAVRRLRTGMRLTVPELSKLTGVAERSIYDIESGRGNPELNTADKLLKPFGLQLGVMRINREGEAGDEGSE